MKWLRVSLSDLLRKAGWKGGYSVEPGGTGRGGAGEEGCVGISSCLWDVLL